MTNVTSSDKTAKLYTKTLDNTALIAYTISKSRQAAPQDRQKEKRQEMKHTPKPQPETDYNGWKNRSTWNVSLWLNNDESLYNAARRAKANGCNTYTKVIRRLGLAHDKTPDGIAWISQELDYPALDAMIDEL